MYLMNVLTASFFMPYCRWHLGFFLLLTLGACSKEKTDSSPDARFPAFVEGANQAEGDPAAPAPRADAGAQDDFEATVAPSHYLACDERPYRQALTDRTFDLANENAYAEAKARPLSAPEAKERLQQYWDRVDLPIRGDFRAYEQLYLIGALGQDAAGRCRWLALLERDYNGLNQELWLLAENADGTTYLVEVLAGRYDLAECSFAITATVHQAQIRYQTALACFDEKRARVVRDTVLQVGKLR